MSAMQTIMVTVEEDNVAPMAGAAIADQMVYTGMTATVQSTISDPDGDTLTWEATSSDEMVATAMVDMDGMVTINRRRSRRRHHHGDRHRHGRRERHADHHGNCHDGSHRR